MLVFDVQTAAWESKAAKAPWAKRAFHSVTLVPGDPAVQGDDDELYLIGGSDARRVLGDVWCCNLRTWAWRAVHVQSPGGDALKRAAHGATLHPSSRRCILVHGGCALAAGAYRGDLLIVDVTTPTAALVKLVQAPAPPIARGYHILCAVSSFALVFGGRVDQQSEREVIKPRDAVAMYDATADRWRTDARPTGAEPPSRCSAAACPLYNPAVSGSFTSPPVGALLHGGRGATCRFNDTVLMRCGTAPGTFAWETLGDAGLVTAGPVPQTAMPLPPRNMHAIAAVPIASGPGGQPGWHILMCGGFVESDKCTADAFTTWLPLSAVHGDTRSAAGAMTALAMPAPIVLPSQLPPPGGSQGGTVLEDASQWHMAKPKRARTNAEVQHQQVAPALRRGDLGLAPVAEVRAREELDAAKSRADRAEQELVDVRRQLNDARQRSAELERHSTEVRDLAAAAQRDAAAARALVDAAEKSAALAKDEAAAATRDKANAFARVTEAEAEKRGMETQFARDRAKLGEDLTAARSQLTAEQTLSLRLKADLEDARAKWRAAEMGAEQQRKLAAQSSDELNRIRQDVLHQRTCIEDLEGRLRNMESERAQMKANADIDAKTWRARFESLTRERDEANASKRNADGQMEDLRRRLHVAEQKFMVLQAKANRVQQDIMACSNNVMNTFASSDVSDFGGMGFGGANAGGPAPGSTAATDWGRL